MISWSEDGLYMNGFFIRVTTTVFHKIFTFKCINGLEVVVTFCDYLCDLSFFSVLSREIWRVWDFHLQKDRSCYYIDSGANSSYQYKWIFYMNEYQILENYNNGVVSTCCLDTKISIDLFRSYFHNRTEKHIFHMMIYLWGSSEVIEEWVTEIWRCLLFLSYI